MTTEIRRYTECEKEFECRVRSKKKFCCHLCGAKWHTRNNYHTEHKLNPEYKKERVKYHKLWRANNREHFNHLVLIAWHKKQAKAKGVPFDDNYLAEHMGHRKKQEPRVKEIQNGKE
jgi:hypothetical protein